MKFPVLQLEKDYFAYVVYAEEEKQEMLTSWRPYVQSGAEIGDRHIDAAGNVFLVEEVAIVRCKRLWGIKLFDRWRPVEVEYRYTPAGRLPLDELKNEMSLRTRKWATEGDLDCEDMPVFLSRIEGAGTYEELFRVLHQNA